MTSSEEHLIAPAASVSSRVAIADTLRAYSWLRVVWGGAVIIACLAVGVAIREALPKRVPAIVVVDGQAEAVTSLRPTVGALLADLGVELHPEDRVSVRVEAPVAAGIEVRIQRARPYLIEADGQTREVRSHAGTVVALLAEAGVRLKPADRVTVDGQAAMPGDALVPKSAPPSRTGFPRRAWQAALPAPVFLTVTRAVPVIINDNGAEYTLFTTEATLGEALAASELTLYLGDRVRPPLGTTVSHGLKAFISRSRSVLVSADGHTLRTRTQGRTVGDALVDLGVLVSGSDRVTPALDQPVIDNMAIGVTRVRESVLVEREVIPFESIMVPDDSLELDHQQLAQQGQNGEHRRRFQLVHEDGVETTRSPLDDWIAADPVTRITAFGRKLVSRPLDTPDGTVNYWRKIRMYATSYSPARSGTPRSAAWYGRTRIGLNLRKGIVAVDPSVIPLRSQVYVPGYGVAIAGDTGGGVLGKWIDLGFEDQDYESWHRWIDVYVLDPPPAETRMIRWVLPNYPPPDFPRRR
jgi:uncharacterized protein YabE (DUF348 family)